MMKMKGSFYLICDKPTPLNKRLAKVYFVAQVNAFDEHGEFINGVKLPALTLIRMCQFTTPPFMCVMDRYVIVKPDMVWVSDTLLSQKNPY